MNLIRTERIAMPEAEAAPLVRLRGVTKTFKRGSERVEVLKRLDLDVPRGDFLALMGPSGSGKTTLLNILGGIDSPTSGDVLVDGCSLQSMRDGSLTRWRARHVGFVFQLYHLLPVLTAEENVALPLLLTKLSASERRRRAQSALALVGLADRAGHKPGELSGGQEQRVGIARAIVTDPMILLCDEPTGDLDRKAGDEILHLLHLLNTEHGKTIIMVTHDPRAAARAQHTLFMDKGVLNEEPEYIQ
jgi:putative ABC transport system ATP-binding protein